MCRVKKKKKLTVQQMGRLGGLARAKNMSAAERSASAKKAVAAREAKRKAKKQAKG
jgi:hypothetical protein